MKNNKLLFIILLLLSVTYFISQFYRVSLGVVAIDIARDLNLNSEQLGRLGGIFFLSFALTQIPLGILLDKYNPINVILIMLIFIFLGSLLLSISDKYYLVMLARTLQGIGCGVCLMGPLVILTKVFSSKDFSFYSGIIMCLGGLGAIVATEPFYMLVKTTNWNQAFFFTSIVIIVLVISLFIFFPKKQINQKKIKTDYNLSAFKQIVLNKNFLLMLPMSMFGYASFAFILTLWGGRYLDQVYEVNDEKISIILMLMALFWSVGSLLYGYLEKKLRKKKIIIIISALIVSFFLLLLSLKIVNSILFLMIMFSFMGLFGGFTLVLLSHYRALFNENIIGKVLTSANLFNFSGVFLIQWITGVIIYHGANTFNFSDQLSFSFAFLLVIILLLFSTYLYSKTDEV